MDLKEIDEIFSEFSEEIMALVSGIVMIITVIFFIYAVIPHYGNQFIFLFSLLALLVCFSVPIFFRLSDLTLVPEVVSWLVTGVMIAIFGWIVFHAGYIQNNGSSLSYIIPSGLLGFASSLPLTKGVLIPLFGEGKLELLEIEDETEEDEEDEERIESEFEEDFEKTESDEDGHIKPKEAKDTSEEDEGPW